MADETHASIPDRYRSERAGSVSLGLIPAPDIPEKIARELASQLPELLTNRVDGDVGWEVPVVVDPLTGTDREAPEILDECRERMLREGWDLAVCLTDLPVYRGGRLLPRSREATLRLVQELYEKVREPEADASL